MRITVVNDLTIRTPTVVRIVSEEGSIAFLGSVSPHDERTFLVEDLSASGGYHLLAETGRGEELVSRRFHLFQGAWIRWGLRSNNVSVGFSFERFVPPDSAGARQDTSTGETGPLHGRA